ncbi:OpgC domain-containing protein [Methylibium sp.]|uniref:OpgC domain-containing protein n=1 Tax=Methylibium sp. TaxID=2067992 RepID=UPI003D13448E
MATSHSAHQPTAAPPTARDVSIDILRGVALVSILINHLTWFCMNLGYVGHSVPTLSRFGYSSSAELFFLLSGYLVGYIYGPHKPDYRWWRTTGHLLRRAAQLYLVSLLLYAFVFAVAAAGVLTPEQLDRLRIAALVRAPTQAAWDFVWMLRWPPLLDILFTYVLYLMAAPAFIAVLKAAPRSAILLPVIAYVMSQVAPEFGYLGMGYGDDALAGRWNKLAWSVLFFGGLTAGNATLLRTLKTRLAGSVRAFAVAAGTMGAVTLLFLVDTRTRWLDPFFTTMPGIDQPTLGPTRILHTLVVISTFFTAMWAFPSLARSRPGRLLQTVGEHPLPVFAAGVGLTYSGALLYVHLGESGSAYLVAVVLALLATVALACALRWKAQALATASAAPRGNPAGRG